MSGISHNVTLTRHWVREVDRRAVEEFGMSGLVLMENAARGAVEVLLSLGCHGPIAIACGRGNNAGDGFAMARLLDALGIPVRVILLSDPAGLSGDAATNFRILKKCGLPIVRFGQEYNRGQLDVQLSRCDCIVDALLGTGSTGEPRPPLGEVIEHLNRQDAIRLAVDLPSGLDCDSGRAAPSTFRAHHTVTFVAVKPGLLVAEARPFVGQLHVVDIGVPRVLLEEIFRVAAQGAGRNELEKR